LAASSPMHNNTRQKAPVRPLSYVGTRAADRRPLAPIITAKLEILVRPKGPHWLTLFRPAVRHDPPNRMPISPIEARFVREGENSRSNFGEFLGAERTFLTFYTRLDGSGDYLHWRPVLDKKKLRPALTCGEKEDVSWKIIGPVVGSGD
jgi:hypothetical protein